MVYVSLEQEGAPARGLKLSWEGSLCMYVQEVFSSKNNWSRVVILYLNLAFVSSVSWKVTSAQDMVSSFSAHQELVYLSLLYIYYIWFAPLSRMSNWHYKFQNIF